jgi:exopolysaccharide biosynthesis polyprenyl glycosylphosphotransferase
MTDKRTRFSLFILKLGDLAALATGLAIVSLSHGIASTAEFLSSHISVNAALLGGLLLLGWRAMLAAQGLYLPEKPRRTDELKAIVRAVVLSSIALLVAARAGDWAVIGVSETVRFALVSLALLVGIRFAVLARLRRSEPKKSLLIVGGGPRGLRFAEQTMGRADSGYRLLGYVESDPAFNFYELAGKPCLGGIEDLPRIVAGEVVDEVIIALPIKSRYEEIERVIASLEEQGITAHLPSDLFAVQLSRCQAAEFEGTPLVMLQSAPRFDWRAEIKRIADLVLAIPALIVLLPVFALVALAIRLDSKGPVFFVQQRMGFRKRPFRLFKFRTMVVDAEARMKEIEHLNEKDGPIFKVRNDPRVTRLGAFLRKTSIDELPQLLNVVLGEMSLVGPRPLSMRDALGMSEAWQKRRFSVKPGLTCLWQISGRSDLSFERWMQLDLEYIDRWSLGLDVNILLRTVPAVLTARGAA